MPRPVLCLGERVREWFQSVLYGPKNTGEGDDTIASPDGLWRLSCGMQDEAQCAFAAQGCALFEDELLTAADGRIIIECFLVSTKVSLIDDDC